MTPAGAAHHRVLCDVPRYPVYVGQDGGFAFYGLTEGRYDLHVSEETGSFYTFAGAIHRFPDVPAGTRGLELRLPERRSVRVTVRTRGGDATSMIVLHGKRHPLDPASHPRIPAPRAIEVDGLSPWPEGASFGWGRGGIGGTSDASGPMSIGYYGTDEVQEHRLAPVEPGWYVFGIHARGGQGSFHPVATRELYFEGGDYTIDFELRPTADVRGRIASATPEVAHAVSLLTEDGRRIALRSGAGHSRMVEVLEVGASGAFVLRGLPVGAHRLRVGTPAELRQGLFRYEVPVELEEGENPPLELR